MSLGGGVDEGGETFFFCRLFSDNIMSHNQPGSVMT